MNSEMHDKTYYTTTGGVRGSCGHKHRTLVAAAKCISRDDSGCGSQGGYSDRIIMAVERDEERELNDYELRELDDYYADPGRYMALMQQIKNAI